MEIFSTNVLGSIGLVPFSCNSNRSFSFSSKSMQASYNFAEHKPLNAPPVFEKISPNATTFNLTIDLVDSLGAPPEIYRSILEEMVLAGDSYPLFLATKYLGKYIITNLDIQDSHFAIDGSSLVSRANLTLVATENFTLKSLINKVKGVFNDGLASATDMLS